MTCITTLLSFVWPSQLTLTAPTWCPFAFRRTTSSKTPSRRGSSLAGAPSGTRTARQTVAVPRSFTVAGSRSCTRRTRRKTRARLFRARLLRLPAIRLLPQPENTHHWGSITEHLTSCLLWFGFSCFAYIEWTIVLLAWSNANQSKQEVSGTLILPPLWWVFSASTCARSSFRDQLSDIRLNNTSCVFHTRPIAFLYS